jgi:DNA-binding HxlR family transcriptional regulator
MTTPTDGYGQYCPISRAAEVLGERWTLLIVRDMLCGVTRFNELARGLPGLSRSLLSRRLRQLCRAGVVEQRDGEYHLTPAGRDLHAAVFGLGEWAARWQFDEPRENEKDPELLMWWAHRRIDFDLFPDRRIVLSFVFRDDPRRFWIVKDHQGPSLCMVDPGFEVDAQITTDLVTMSKVWLGRRPLQDALHHGHIAITGTTAVVRALPNALLLSPAAHLSAPAR